MCTAIRYKDSFFGRTLDLEYSLGESVVFTPRRHPISFSYTERTDSHFAMLGIGIVKESYPLYYDAINERGLWMAALNFPHYAHYNRGRCGALNLASYEVIPYILSRYESVSDALSALPISNVTDTSFSGSLPPSPLHWMLCDSQSCAVIEQTREGLKVYNNEAGVLTNSPPFEFQMQNLSQYLSLTPYPTASRFSEKYALTQYSRGMGAIGLPGDVSSSSRFVRAAFTLTNASEYESEREKLRQFFHILGTVEQVSGTVRLENGKLERTQYTSCADIDTLTYYYTTYENPTPSGVCMKREALDSQYIVSYPLIRKMKIEMQN